MIPDYARQAADEYRRMLREIKRQGLSMNDLPADVAEAWLALHQNALTVYWLDKQEKKNA